MPCIMSQFAFLAELIHSLAKVLHVHSMQAVKNKHLLDPSEELNITTSSFI